MAYEVTARRWRPQTFDGVVGQEHVTTTLKNAIQSGQIAHAYLFAGPRGVGKTTTARILAKALNCVEGPTATPCNTCGFCLEIAEGRSLDVLEIDGASHNKVEQVRSQLLESVKYTPSQGKHKIYIIDEVHMLTKEAFNALLKTLEEPPPHVYFIFATTDPQKVLPTILSRCQRFDFRRIAGQAIVDHLAMIAGQSGCQIDREALALIARRADGSLRDAESLFDQVVAFGGETLTAHHVASVLGMIEQDVYFELGDLIASHDAAQGLRLVDRIVRQGYHIDEVVLGILEHLRNLLIVRSSPDTPDLLDTAAVDLDRYRNQAAVFQVEDLLRLIRMATEMEEAVKQSAMPRIQLEAGIVRMIRMESSVLLTDVMKRLSDLAQHVEGEPGGSMPDDAGAPARPARQENRASPAEPATTPPELRASSTPPSTGRYRESGGAASSFTAPAETRAPSRAVETMPSPKPPPAASGAASAPETQSLAGLIRLWPSVLEWIKQQRIALGNFLGCATVVGYESGVVTLGFSSQHEFHRQNAEKRENRDLIRTAFERILGGRVRVVCATIDETPSEAGAPAQPPASAQEIDRQALAAQDPAVKRLVEAFDGTIIQNNI